MNNKFKTIAGSLLTLLLMLVTIPSMAQDYPFKLTTIEGDKFADGTEFYFIFHPDSNVMKYQYVLEDGLKGVRCSHNKYEVTKNLKENRLDRLVCHLWAFVADGDGFKIYNKRVGTQMPLDVRSFVANGTTYYYDAAKGLYCKEKVKGKTQNAYLYDELDESKLYLFYEENDGRSNLEIKSLEEYKKMLIDEEIAEGTKGCTKDFGVEYTTITDGQFAPNTKWYIIEDYTLSSEDYLRFCDNEPQWRKLSSPSMMDCYLWAFVKGPVDGTFYLYNKDHGAKEALGNDSNPSLFCNRYRHIYSWEYDNREYVSKNTTGIKAYEGDVKKQIDAVTAKVEAEAKAAAAKQKQDYRAMITKVGQVNYNKLMANQMPKGITLNQLDTYATYIHKYYEESDHDIRFEQIRDNVWDITLAKNNNAAKYEDRVVYFNYYRIYLVNGRVGSYSVLHR